MRLSAGGIKAVDVWDVLVTAITAAGSIGEVLDDLTATKIGYIDQAISTPPFTPYSYSGALANATTFVPPAKTIVMAAALAGVDAAQEFMLNHQGAASSLGKNSYGSSIACQGYHGSIYCDGTNIGFYNGTGASNTLYLYGVTMA